MEDIIIDCQQEKSGEYAVGLLSDFYLSQSISVKNEIDDLLIEWIRIGDIIKVDYAIALCSDLHITKSIPVLEEELQSINNNSSRLPKYFSEFLRAAINRLNSNV